MSFFTLLSRIEKNKGKHGLAQTRKEMRGKLQAVFNKADIDANSRLGLDELVNVLQSQELATLIDPDGGKPLSKYVAFELFREADEDGSKDLDFHEFVQLVDRASLRDTVREHTAMNAAAIKAGWAPAKGHTKEGGKFAHLFKRRKHCLEDEAQFHSAKHKAVLADRGPLKVAPPMSWNALPHQANMNIFHEVRASKAQAQAQVHRSQQSKAAELEAAKAGLDQIERRENELLKARVAALEKKIRALKAKPDVDQPRSASTRSGSAGRNGAVRQTQTSNSGSSRGGKSPKSPQSPRGRHLIMGGRSVSRYAVDNTSPETDKKGAPPQHSGRSTVPQRSRFDGQARLSNYFNHHGVYPGSSKFMQVIRDFPPAPNGGIGCKVGDVLYINYGAHNAYDGMIMAITYDGKREGVVPYKSLRPVASDTAIAAGFDVHHLAVLDAKYLAARRRSAIGIQGNQGSVPTVLAGGDPHSVAEFEQNLGSMASDQRMMSVTRIGGPAGTHRSPSSSLAGSPEKGSQNPRAEPVVNRDMINQRVAFHNVRTPYHSPLANAKPAPQGAWCC